jgi:hypothetical protein
MSKVDVLVEAIQGLNPEQLKSLRIRVAQLQHDKVGILYDAICTLTVDELRLLQDMMVDMLRRPAEPPPATPGNEAGTREPLVPKDPQLSDATAKKMGDEC